MTGEPMHTASKEMMATEVMFSTERAPQISIINSKVKWLLRFTFSLSNSATNEEQVGEVPLQSIQSPQKIWTIPVGNHCATATHLTVSKKKWDTKEDKGKSIIRTAVCQKAHLGTRQCQTMKKSSL